MILILIGCAGLLAARLGISTVVSTDSVRHMLRSFTPATANPLLWASTYEVGVLSHSSCCVGSWQHASFPCLPALLRESVTISQHRKIQRAQATGTRAPGVMQQHVLRKTARHQMSVVVVEGALTSFPTAPAHTCL